MSDKTESKIPGLGWRMITPERGFIALMALVVIVTFAVIIVTLNRGFDWTDEAFVYTMISSNRSSPGEYWGFQHLLHPVYELFGNSVIAFRILRLIGYIALGGLLSFVAKKILDSFNVSLRRSSWVVISLLAQTGTFAAWSYPPRYLGYNELSSWLAQVGGAVLLYLLVTSKAELTFPKQRVRVWLLWAFLGVLIAMLSFAKVTAAILFIVLVVLVALLPSQTSLLKRIGALVGGVIVALALMLSVGVPVFDYATSIVEQIVDPSAREASGYSVFELMKTYIFSATLTSGALAVPLVLAAYVLIVGGGYLSKSHTSPGMPMTRTTLALEHTALVLAAFLAIVLLLPSTLSTWESIGIANTFAFCLAVLAFVMALPAPSPSGPLTPPRALLVSVGILLFAMTPFVNAVGTNNAIFGQTVFSATLWAVGAGVALCVLWERSTAHLRSVRFLPVVLAGAMIASSGLAVAADVFVHPYRTAPYLSQTSPVETGDLRGMQLTAGEPELIEWLQMVGAREEAASLPAVGIGFPGRLLAFNASGWASPWPGVTWQSSIERACDAERPETLFVLQPLDATSKTDSYEQLVAGLQHCDIDFPDDFVVVDQYDDGADGKWNTTVWKMK